MSYNFDVGDKALLIRMREVGIIKVGELTQLKDGSYSPIYMDVRDKLTDSHPELLLSVGRKFCEKIWKVTKSINRRQCLIGVPDAAHSLACATVLASLEDTSKPTLSFIIQRKVAKKHGTLVGSRMIGMFKPNTEYNLIDDVITTSKSKRESAAVAGCEGFKIKRIFVLFDRQQGGAESLVRDGYEFHAVYRILEVAEFFLDEGLITDEEYHATVEFIGSHQVG